MTVLTGHDARDVGDDDRLAKHGALEDVANGSVGRLPHLPELELCKAQNVDAIASHHAHQEVKVKRGAAACVDGGRKNHD